MDTKSRSSRFCARFECYLLMIVALAAMVPSRSASQNESRGRQIAERLLPSTAEVHTHGVLLDRQSIGTGFLVAPRLLATSLHLVKDAFSVSVRFPGDRYMSWQWIQGYVAVDTDHDLVILQLERPQQIRPLRLGRSESAAVGDEVFVVGNPLGLEGTFSTGIVSGRRGDGYMQFTAPISPGSSGGPVADGKGRVIGVVSGVLSAGQNLNFAIPASFLSRLLQSLSKLRPIAMLVPSPRFDGFYKTRGALTGITTDDEVTISETTTYLRFYPDGTLVISLTDRSMTDVLQARLLRRDSAADIEFCGTWVRGLVEQTTYRMINDSTASFQYTGTSRTCKFRGGTFTLQWGYTLSWDGEFIPWKEAYRDWSGD